MFLEEKGTTITNNTTWTKFMSYEICMDYNNYNDKAVSIIELTFDMFY